MNAGNAGGDGGAANGIDNSGRATFSKVRKIVEDGVGIISPTGGL